MLKLNLGMRANMVCYPKMGPPPAVASIPWPSPSNVAVRIRACASTPARDRVIELGKYKGRMLGSLPSAYLKWVSKNLRAGDTEEWAKLADRVLEDPVYRDRMEWEAADKILSGDGGRSWSGRSAVAELLEISERFGWDNEDKAGWSKVDFGLLGTSKGGRIPRLTTSSLNEEEDHKNTSGARAGAGAGAGAGGGRRGERRERVRRMRLREKTATTTAMEMEMEMEGDEERETSRRPPSGTLFPGREALFIRALNRHTL